jgi:uncharacterized protein with gpF-like domain
MRAFLKEELKNYRRKLSPRVRALSYKKKQLRMKYPFMLERRIYVKVRDTFAAYTNTIMAFVLARYPKTKMDSIHTDDFGTEFENFMGELEADYTSEVVRTGLTLNFTPYIMKISEFLLVFSQNEVDAYMRNLFGRPMYGTTEWWEDVQTEWLTNAVNRVVGEVSHYYIDARQLVLESIRDGVSFEDMVARLRKMDGSLTEAKANFIAKDLTGKLNGQMERKIQLGLGIDTYLWQTMGDERVRGRPGGRYPNAVPSHWAIDSIACDWNNPMICSFDYGETWVPRLANMPHTHPGDDWQCRCLGTPFSLNLLREVDRELAREGS